MSVYKMHEVRMWIVQVVVPLTLVVGYVATQTDIPDRIKQKKEQIKLKLKTKKARK